MAHSWGVASEHIVEEVHKVAQDLVPGGGAGVGQVGGVRGWEGGSRLQGLPGLGYQYDWWLRGCLCNIKKVIRTLTIIILIMIIIIIMIIKSLSSSW